jgi:hypothetical protein
LPAWTTSSPEPPRGEVREGVDAAAVLESLVAPAYLRLLITAMPLDEALVERSVRSAQDLARRASP